MRNSVGDGSKTAILMFQRMLDSGTIALKRNHATNDLLRGMERATEAAAAVIKSQAQPANPELLKHVARTASGGDNTIAALVADAYAKAGPDGFTVIEQTNSTENSLIVQEGMYFDRGYVDADLITPEETRECVLEDAYILIYEHKISSMNDLLPLLGQVARIGKPLLIIADDVEGEALATLVVNRKRGTLNCMAVKAPGYADRRKAILQDIAVLTTATAITLGLGRRLESATIRDLGRARKTIITKEATTILGGAGEANLSKHISAIREELSRSTEPFATEKLRERLARLGGAVAAVRIGGISQQELDERTYRAQSAMHSVQKAAEEGIVAGGGSTLLRAGLNLKTLMLKKQGELAGVKVIADALQEPVRQHSLNSRKDPEEIIKLILRSKEPTKGFEAETGTLRDLVAAGVVDPVATVHIH